MSHAFKRALIRCTVRVNIDRRLMIESVECNLYFRFGGLDPPDTFDDVRRESQHDAEREQQAQTPVDGDLTACHLGIRPSRSFLLVL